MAKRPPMGKGLGALLGSARQSGSKEGADSPKDTPSDGGTAINGEPAAAGVSVPDNRAGPAQLGDAADGNVASEETVGPGDRLAQISIDRIRRGAWQPRQQFDQQSLQELADSIKVQGLIQPILVRPFADGYEIIAGERRWRAAQLAGLHEMPAIIRELNDKSVAAISLIENIQRKDLNPMEEARALQRLQLEFDMTHQDIAEAVGRSRAAVSNLLRLLDLHDEVKVLLEKGEIDMGHARALLALSPKLQCQVAEQVVRRGLSVRATEALVRQIQQAESGGSKKAREPRKDPNITSLEKDLSDRLGAGVSIDHRADGGGKLEISYTSSDELQGILDRIR